MAGNKRYVVTPAGEAVYPKVIRPDRPEYGGDYKISLKLPLEKARDLVKTIHELANEAYPAGKVKAANFRWPYVVNKEEGTVLFKFRTDNKPGLFNVKGEVEAGDVPLGAGSIVKVSACFTPASEKAKNPGIKAYLNGVQIVKLIKFQPGANFGNAESELEDGDVGYYGEENGNTDSVADSRDRRGFVGSHNQGTLVDDDPLGLGSSYTQRYNDLDDDIPF